MTRTDARHRRLLPKPAMATLPDGTRESRVGVALHRDEGSAIERPDGAGNGGRAASALRR